MKSTEKYIVIIPARGGSKGLENKNLQLIDGIPLIKFAVNKFKNLDYISKIVVSSDSDEILSTVNDDEVICIKRPISLSKDQSSSESAISHAIDYLYDLKFEFSDIIFHQCTSPLLSVKTIREMITFYSKNNINETLFTTFSESNPIWSFNQKSNTYFQINKSEKIRLPRQLRKSNLIETGGLYIFKKFNFVKTKNRFSKSPIPYIIPFEEGIDIDDIDDLNIANKLIKKL